MSQVIPCPNCQKKLALRSEMAGRRLACPHCKHVFQAPAPTDELAAGDVEKLADLVATTQTAGQAIAPAAADTDGFGFLSDVPERPGKRAVTPARARFSGDWVSNLLGKKNGKPPIQLIVGAGAAAAVALLGLIVLLVSTCDGSGGKKGGAVTVKWGLAERQRRDIYYQLIQAVDSKGWNTPGCREEWKQIQAKYKITGDVAEQIIDEGNSARDWQQPAPGGNAQAHQNRIRWTKERTESRGVGR